MEIIYDNPIKVHIINVVIGFCILMLFNSVFKEWASTLYVKITLI